MSYTPTTLTKPFYEKNELVLNDPTVNVAFDELLSMSDDEFEQWMTHLRATMLKSWDTCGCPPRSGKTEDTIIKTFNLLPSFNTPKMIFTDELNDEQGVDAPDDVILNVARKGTEIDQFFPTMMKARINYTSNDSGYSVYDMLREDKYLPRMIRGGRRHFLNDSFYHYSMCVKKNDTKSGIVAVPDAHKWLQAFWDRPDIFRNHDFWIQEVAPYAGKTSGYHPVESSEFICLTADEVRDLREAGKLTDRQVRNLDFNDLKDGHQYLIRLFKFGQKLFPKAFIAFKIGYIQVAVNYPPMTAKYLWERFTNHLTDRIGVEIEEPIIVYDPSSGWGGRLLGALTVKDDRRIHYIGVDPNPECWDQPGGTSRYEALLKFFTEGTYRGNAFLADNEPATAEFFQDGSECVSEDPRFQKYEGKIDMVFTSPPYFNREAYGDDPKQSYKKFPQYDSWKEGYLRPTLETCVKYLRPGGYLLWNIADLLQGKEYLPLQEDSRKILEALGMVPGDQAPGDFRQPAVLKMAMQSMPGQHRLNEDGTPKSKNFCRVDGVYYKYEPIFVFWKPLETT